MKVSFSRYTLPCVLTLLLLPISTPLFAQDEVPSVSELSSDKSSLTDHSNISKPDSLQGGGESSGQAPSANQKPSQGEGEKAPLQNRPTAVPEFSLPEVVITGENELTIGAKRLDRKENDVTLGSRDLTGVDRAVNDLPGLNKTFTALTAEEAGPSKNTAFILHAGGGSPNTYGGWGLFGQQFKDFQYLLNGYYSTWSGEATAGGFDGDKKYKYGLDIKLFPSSPFNLVLSGNMMTNDIELPYQGSVREVHQGSDQSGALIWKISNSIQAQMKVSNQPTTLTYWDSGLKTNQAQELEGQFKLTADEVDPFLNRLVLELGGRHANSDFPPSSASGYDWSWFGLQAQFKEGEDLSLTAKCQGQSGTGLDLPLQFFPVLDFTWRFFGKSQLNLYFQTDRYVDSFHNTFMPAEHISPLSGFPLPTEVSGEWGGRFTQKISEKIIVSISASSAQIRNYHQWTDLNPLTPSNIQTYSTLAAVQMNRAGANIQWSFMKDWQAAATYQWTQGSNNSGDGLNLTSLPTHRGILSLYRGDESLETRLELQAFSDRQAYDSASSTLPAAMTLGLDATYHISKTFSLWLNGDNLLGQAIEIQPGYLEPRFHVRAGLEVIF
jgi:hypothetical protein